MSKQPAAYEHDEELLAALAVGEPDAAEIVVRRLAPLVGRMVFRLTGWHSDVQDLTQEVFLAIQKSAPSFRGDSQLETWVTSITIHCCRNWRRSKLRYPHSKLDECAEPVDESFDLAQRRDEVREELAQALQELEHEQRELIVLRYLEGLSLDELAQLLKTRKNTLEVRLIRARKKLGELLNLRFTCC